MKIPQRLHVHINVADLDQSVAYYSALFGTGPTREKPSYAQWRLDDPSVNFAISTSCGDTPGLSHLGIQMGDDASLDQLHDRLQAADQETVEDKNATCCYARSDKHWSQDPSGVAWEFFHTHEDLEAFGDARMLTRTEAQPTPGGCC